MNEETFFDNPSSEEHAHFVHYHKAMQKVLKKKIKRVNKKQVKKIYVYQEQMLFENWILEPSSLKFIIRDTSLHVKYFIDKRYHCHGKLSHLVSPIPENIMGFGTWLKKLRHSSNTRPKIVKVPCVKRITTNSYGDWQCAGGEDCECRYLKERYFLY